MQFDESDRLRKRARQLIPGGAHTYSKGDDQFPQLSPGFMTRAKGALAWDPDGNEFLDWGMGLRSVCLGHAHEPVLEAVRAQLEKGVNFTRPSPLEADLAGMLGELIPSAEMVKFAKNGSDVTTAAVRLARACTGRDLILRCLDHPFFSVDDWFIGDTAMDAGIPRSTKDITRNFPFNDATALERVLGENRGRVACIILEPAATAAPAPGYLERVRELATQHGAVLIFDEIITGFRWDVRGAQHFYGVRPDLSTFGKAMANGFSLAALVGKREIMELGGLEHDKPRVFLLSTTNGAETHCLSASLCTIGILRDTPVIAENWKIGKQLREGFNRLASAHGIGERARMEGVDISPWYAFYDAGGKVDLSLRTLFLQETIRHGVLIPYVSISASHREAEVARTLDAVDKALRVIARAVEKGSVEGLLVGPVVKPVFRKFN
ncbi:MAG TPA: glutamate-1-semialdehyde 2,1-aminomutase [Gammaproteobacteria bacterium]